MTEMIPTTINERWTLLLPEHRAARTEWPVWEKERLAAMYDCITSQYNPVVFDIGAEEGDFPALWASWRADVVLVEPNPKVWPNIRAIFEGNGLSQRIVGHFVGFAGDELRDGAPHWLVETKPRKSYDSDPWWPSCAFGPVIGDHGFLVLPERPEVPIATIDYLSELWCKVPSVITIDVEGAELTVLRGAEKTLTHFRPRVFVSVHIDMPWIDEKYPGDTGEKVVEFMESFGYIGTHLATDHEEHWEWRHPEGE